MTRTLVSSKHGPGVIETDGPPPDVYRIQVVDRTASTYVTLRERIFWLTKFVYVLKRGESASDFAWRAWAESNFYSYGHPGRPDPVRGVGCQQAEALCFTLLSLSPRLQMPIRHMEDSRSELAREQLTPNAIGATS
jgi:hypothetical protein